MKQKKPTINYQIYGRKNLGTPITITPGVMSDLHAFDGIATTLANKGYTVVVYDTPDHGKSSKLSGFKDGRFKFVSIIGQTNTLGHVLKEVAKEYLRNGSSEYRKYGEKLLEEGPVVIGHSAGSATVIEYAKTRKTRGLLFIAPTYGLSSADPIMGILRKRPPFFTPHRFRLFFSLVPGLSKRERQERLHGSKTNGDGLYGLFEAAHAYEPGVLEYVHPVGMVHGEYEVGLAKVQQESLEQVIKSPEIKRYTMRDVGHNFLNSHRREIVDSIDSYCNLLKRD